MMAWSGEHGLRGPLQAGFHSRWLPFHPLFALRHFIDRAVFQQRALIASFLDVQKLLQAFQKAYDTVQHGL